MHAPVHGRCQDRTHRRRLPSPFFRCCDGHYSWRCGRHLVRPVDASAYACGNGDDRGHHQDRPFHAGASAIISICSIQRVRAPVGGAVDEVPTGRVRENKRGRHQHRAAVRFLLQGPCSAGEERRQGRTLQQQRSVLGGAEISRMHAVRVQQAASVWL